MYSKDRFFVTHTTNSSNLEYILETGSIQPLSLQKKLFEEQNPGKNFTYEFNSDYYGKSKDSKKYINSVFYGFLYPNKDGEIHYDPMMLGSSVHFIFSSKIIQDNANMYGCRKVHDLPIFCKGWNYGKIDEKCSYYNCKRSLEYNLNKWRNIMLKTESSFNPWNGMNMNEILLEGEMPIDLDLVAIYLPYNDKLKNLKEKYPHYNWIHDRKDLKIPNLSNEILDFSFLK